MLRKTTADRNDAVWYDYIFTEKRKMKNSFSATRPCIGGTRMVLEVFFYMNSATAILFTAH